MLLIVCCNNSPADSLLRNHVRKSTERPPNIRWNRRLRAHFDSLERTQRNVRNKLSRCTRRQVQGRLPLGCPFRSHKIAIEFLEKFVASVFERSLGLEFN